MFHSLSSVVAVEAAIGQGQNKRVQIKTHNIQGSSHDVVDCMSAALLLSSARFAEALGPAMGFLLGQAIVLLMLRLL